MMSAEMDKMAADLLAFQREVIDPRKDARNPHFNSKFVPLEGAIEALRPIANKHNISITQWRVGLGLTTLLLHSSGQYIRGDAEMVLDKITPQGLGSAVTYERRYSLLAATGTSGDVDDDAEGAMMRDKPKAAPLPEVDSHELQQRFLLQIAEATNLASLKQVGGRIKADQGHLSDDAIKSLKALYAGKQHELEIEVMGNDD